MYKHRRPISKLRRLSSLLCITATTTLFLAVPPATQAETIKIGVSQQGGVNQAIKRPKLGMEKHEVKTQFGTPVSATAPTGKPPIEQWKYDNFTVYFEGNYVIHSVLHSSKPITNNNTPDHTTPNNKAPQ